jgi:hypothetical protein
LGVTLNEIDLRWGITEEQVAAGHVVSLCLDQVEQARPFFVGLIGTEYGTCVSEFSDEARSRWPWLGDCRGRSMTELEVRLGALNAFNAQALFYFKRAPDALPLSPDVDRLRTQIEEAGYCPRLYTEPRQLDHFLHADLWPLLRDYCLQYRPKTSNAFLAATDWHDAAVEGLHPVLDRSEELAGRIAALPEDAARAVAILSQDDAERAAQLAALSRHVSLQARSPVITYIASASRVHANARVP